LQAFGSTTWTTDAGPLDVLRELPVTGGRRTFDELIQRSTDVDVDGIVIHVASLDDIIDSKTHANRPKDQEALPNSTTSVERHPTPDHPTQHELAPRVTRQIVMETLPRTRPRVGASRRVLVRGLRQVL
jgi:hypothetical protein